MIKKSVIQEFIDLSKQYLQGDWVLIGGAVPIFMGISKRSTLDIDLAAPETADTRQTIALMGIAETLGLPIEAINTSASYFLRKISNWEKMLVPIYKNKAGRLYRPNTTLFLLLKIERLSEADLQDCLAMVSFSYKSNEIINKELILNRLLSLTKNSQNPAQKKRLSSLIKKLKT